MDLRVKITELLKYLKENGAIGIKSEFAQEGSTFEETFTLKEFAQNIQLPLTIKIGGCEAIKDLYDAVNLKAENIVAPMIESFYASKKYICNVKSVFNGNNNVSAKFFINIETELGLKNLEEILKKDTEKILSGVVFGRTDMAESLECNDVNSDIILNYAKEISQICKNHNREFTIGGGISPLSIPFLKTFSKSNLTKFETRKIIFDSESLKNSKIEEIILNAIEFEILWIKYKENFYGNISPLDKQRIKTLESRFLTTNVKMF